MFPSGTFLFLGQWFLRLKPSMIYFRSTLLTSLCSKNNLSQYRIRAPKDYSKAIAWVSSCPFPSGPSCIIVLFSNVSATSALVYSPACSLLIFIYPPVVCLDAAVGWASGAIVASALVRVAIGACGGLKDFSAFTQDTAIYWDVDELYSPIFFSINGGTVA